MIGDKLSRLERRGKVIAEKNLNRNNDRERDNNHHCKRQRDQRFLLTIWACTAFGLCGELLKNQLPQTTTRSSSIRRCPNLDRRGLDEDEHMFNNDKNQHDVLQKENWPCHDTL